LNLAHFISRRLVTAKNNNVSVATPIVKIAITSIALGILMMIVSVATGVGLQNKIRQKIAAFNGHILITNYDTNESNASIVPINKFQNFYTKPKLLTNITHIQAVANKAGIIRTATDFEGVVFKGVGKDYQWVNIKDYLIAGRIPNFTTAYSPEVVISKFLANRLNLKLGDSFNTFFLKSNQNQLPSSRRFKIVGIFNSGFQEFDANYVIGDLQHIQRMNKWNANQVGGFELFVSDFDKIQEIGAEVYKKIDPTLDAKTIVEKYSFIFEWLKLFDTNIIIIIIIMILVATINMAVTLLVLILERTQMIGVLKSIGADNWMIRKIFIYNAAYIIMRGLFWGNLIAISFLLIQKQFGIIQLNPENYYVTQAPVDINILNILFLNAITIVISLIVLLLPSYIITKISPVQALKHE
jgi:lipoprotein-releasing system permease protein